MGVRNGLAAQSYLSPRSAAMYAQPGLPARLGLRKGMFPKTLSVCPPILRTRAPVSATPLIAQRRILSSASSASAPGSPAPKPVKEPFSLRPYVELMRLDRPIGTYLLFWPCGTLLQLTVSLVDYACVTIRTCFSIRVAHEPRSFRRWIPCHARCRMYNQ